MELGKYLRGLRKEKKKTLVQLAEETGLSHSYLSQVENGKKLNPSMDSLMKICKALNEDPFNFLIATGHHEEVDTLWNDGVIDIEPMVPINRPSFVDKEDNEILNLFKDKQNIVYYNGHQLTYEDKQKIVDVLKAIFPQYQN